MTSPTKTRRLLGAQVAEVREIAGAQMILIRELSAQIQMLKARVNVLEGMNGTAIDLRDRPRAVDPDPHLGRF